MAADTLTVREPHTALDADAVRAAYRRWAGVYDTVFGGVSRAGRRRAVAAVNALPGTRVLEVGVGTGLALPDYKATKRITGIDLSAEMLALARRRVAGEHLAHVEGLHEVDAECTGFADGGRHVRGLGGAEPAPLARGNAACRAARRTFIVRESLCCRARAALVG